MKAAHDYLWPEQTKTWTHWDERKFRAHVEGWECITLAGGASTSKSFTVAKIVILFWLANPKKRAVLVMSTTLESLNSRIYGYVCRMMTEIKLPFEFKIYRGTSPKITYPNAPDYTHSICAVAAKKGDSDTAISSLIGRHPTEGLMIVADEATDLPTAILGAIPNLSRGVQTFQILAIGNSNSKNDLHGALSTPKDGWDKIDPLTTFRWETTQNKGICLFFSCYDSPAIVCPDATIRERVSKFYITKEQIADKEKIYGKNSDSFWRFVIGFWKADIADSTYVTEKFIKAFNVKEYAHWLGRQQLKLVAGLDPAFTKGGDDCILRIAALGQEVTGKTVLDFKNTNLTFKIPIVNNTSESAEIQIANNVLKILNQYHIGLDCLAVDASGQGRGLAEIIKLVGRSAIQPIKIFATKGDYQSIVQSTLLAKGLVKSSDRISKKFADGNEIVMGNVALWDAMKKFIESDQIRGLDSETIFELTSRLLITKPDGKMYLETKHDYRMRMGAINPMFAKSPDKADAACLCVVVAVIRHGFCVNNSRPAENFTWQDSKVNAYLSGLTGNGNYKTVMEEHARGRPPEANFTTSLEELHSSKL